MTVEHVTVDTTDQPRYYCGTRSTFSTTPTHMTVKHVTVDTTDQPRYLEHNRL